MNSIISGPGLDQSTLEARGIEDPATPISMAALNELLAGGSTGAGEVVTPQSSMKVAAVWACVWAISAAIARMPLITYEKTDQGRERATGHPLYRLLRLRPNPDMSAFTFIRTMMLQVLLWGNGYAEIVRDRRGVPVALIPIEAARVRPIRSEGELMYRVYTDGETVTLLKRDVLHLVGLSLDGIVGMSVIAHARQTIGASLSGDKYMGTLMANGMRPSGVITHPGKLGMDGQNNLRDSIHQVYAGPSNAGKPLILEEGATWSANAMPPQDAQFVESAYLRIEDICRWFNVPPHKIQHLLRATNNNIEQQSLDWLSDTVAPWVECFQQEANGKLFSGDELDTVYAEFLTQVLVQMDAKTRSELYWKMFQMGAITADEIRARENMNNLPEDRGTVAWVLSSWMPAATPSEAEAILKAYTAKAGTGGPGQPQPKTDDKVADAG